MSTVEIHPDALGDSPLKSKYPWLVGQSWSVLHYVPGVADDTWEHWWDSGANPGFDENRVRAACGQTIQAELPGILSRMGTPRCSRCCRALGIPTGDGAPVNDQSLREPVQ